MVRDLPEPLCAPQPDVRLEVAAVPGRARQRRYRALPRPSRPTRKEACELPPRGAPHEEGPPEAPAAEIVRPPLLTKTSACAYLGDTPPERLPRPLRRAAAPLRGAPPLASDQPVHHR